MAVVATETDRAPDLAAARAAGEVVKAFVAGLEAACYSGADSVSLVTFFTEMERTAVAGKTLAARRVEESNVHLLRGHRSAAELLAAQTGDSLGEAKGLIRLGEQLADQPDLEVAFRDGRLSRRRVALVSDAAKVNPDRERDLVGGAQTDSDASLKERCLRAKAEGRSKEDAERHQQAAARAALGPDLDGRRRGVLSECRVRPRGRSRAEGGPGGPSRPPVRRGPARGPFRDLRRLPGRRPLRPGHREGDPRAREPGIRSGVRGRPARPGTGPGPEGHRLGGGRPRDPASGAGPRWRTL